jgi:uncharacterized membrane protein YidH (DUF202 family)
MQPTDEGMPQERTLLSWRKTALALSIAGFALARLALSESVVFAVILAAIAFVAVALVVMTSTHQYKSSTTTSGALTFIVAALSFSLGLIKILMIVIK